MTKLNTYRSVRRETAAELRGKALIVELRQYSLTIRAKGARHGYEVDYESIFSLGAKKEVERQRRERAGRELKKGR